MKLSKEDIAILDTDVKAFVVRALRIAHPEMSTREIGERAGVSHTQVRRLVGGNVPANVPADVPVKTATAKGCRAVHVPVNVPADVPVKPDKSPTLTSLLKPHFDSFFFGRTKMDFVWSAREMKSLKELGGKLRSAMKAKGNPYSDEDIAEAFPMFLAIIRDQWILDRLSPSRLNSNYNEIIATHKSSQPNRAEEKRRRADAFDEMRAVSDAILNGRG